MWPGRTQALHTHFMQFLLLCNFRVVSRSGRTLALLIIVLGKVKEAIKCFDRAKNDYSRYYFEHRLHFRCHTFKQLLRSQS